MRIAITLWNNRVSPVFDVAGQAILFEAEDGRVLWEKLLLLAPVPAVEKLSCLRRSLTDVLICGAISLDAHAAAISSGMAVYPFIAGDVHEVIKAWQAGRLADSTFAMPGCGCRVACPGSKAHGRGRRRITGSASFSHKKPD